MIFHCIAGLPRSGSTLLATILRQNPRLQVAQASPLPHLLDCLLRKMSGESLWRADFDEPGRRARILRGLIENYQGFSSGPGGPADLERVCIDHNHPWNGKLGLLHALFPAARVICCVRDIPAILNSVERILRENPLEAPGLFHFNPETTVYSRAAMMMCPGSGFLAQCWEQLKEAWYGPFREKLILLEYDKLISQPEWVLRNLYGRLEQSYFVHDFEHFSYWAEDGDRRTSMLGMHRVEGPIRERAAENFLPPDIVERYSGHELHFWRKEAPCPTKPQTKPLVPA
jgi:sulfotransferase